jgi:spore maturation protein CgeB
VLFLDGGDFSDIGGDLTRLNVPELYQKAVARREFNLVLKREMLIDKQYEQNVIPYPFSVNFDRMPRMVDKKFQYDVSFWAVESDPIRTKALSLLEDKFDCRENGTVKNQVFKKYKRKGTRYLLELQRCRIVLNFKGVGWDTLRYWEVPGLSTFMISQQPHINIPNNFEHEKEVIFCNDELTDLVDLCSYYLKQDLKRDTLARAAYLKAKQFHSNEARAKYLLQHINKFIS